jgi:hypothetical protein
LKRFVLLTTSDGHHNSIAAPERATAVPVTARPLTGSENTTLAIGRRKTGVRLMRVEAIPRRELPIATIESHTPKRGPAAVPAET